MKKNIFSSIRPALIVSLVLLFSIPAFAQQAPQDKDPHKTGLIQMTPEEMAAYEASSPRVTKVGLSKMGLERVNAYRQNKEMPLLPPQAAVADGQDIQTVIGSAPALAEPTGSIKNLDLPNLPDSVDNSLLKYFPPIRSQGDLSSCASFAGTYYTMTYMLAKARDWDAKDGGDAYRLSPKWSYNFLNQGNNGGSSYVHNYDLGAKHGITTWEEFPYDGVDYRSWDLNTAHWRNAIYRRFGQSGYVSNTNTDEGINLVKQMLINGYILNISTYVFSWQYKQITDDPSTPLDDPFVGKQICYWMNGTSGSHAMTVVGYNDNIWVDINSDGVVDPGEKGAFRIANSWGPAWNDEGFAWIAYDALKEVSAVPGGPSVGRLMAWSGGHAFWILARASYTPTLLAEFTLNHLERHQLQMRLGISRPGQTFPEVTWFPAWALSSSGGPFAFDGTTTAINGTFVYDFSDIAPTLISNSGMFRFFLGLGDGNPDGNYATLINFKLIDVVHGELEVISAQAPMVSDGSLNYSRIDYNFTGVNTPPVAVASADPISGEAPLSVTFDGSDSYDLDGFIVSYDWNFGDGVMATGVTVNHIYQKSGLFHASLVVTDNMGATAKKSVVISTTSDSDVLTAPFSLNKRKPNQR